MGKQLKEKSDKLLKDLTRIISQVIIEKQTNEQWFLDFLDELNKQSITF